MSAGMNAEDSVPKPVRNYSAATSAGLPKPIQSQSMDESLPPSYSNSIMDPVPAAAFFAPPTESSKKSTLPIKQPVKPVKTVPYQEVNSDDEAEPEVEANRVQLKKPTTNAWTKGNRFDSTPYNPSNSSYPTPATHNNQSSSYDSQPEMKSKYFNENSTNWNSSDRMEEDKSTSNGVAWITKKVFAYEDEEGAIGGIFSHSLLDFTIEPVGEGYPAPGSWNDARARKMPKEVVKQEEGVEENSINSSSDMTFEEPSKVSMMTVGNRSITEEELADIRPHKDAYYSTETFSWVVFTAVKPVPAGWEARKGTLHLWRIHDASVDPGTLNIKEPFPPAAPNILSHKIAMNPPPMLIPHLTLLYSNQSGIPDFAYSDEGIIPTVIPQKLMKQFIAARSVPIPGDASPAVALTSSLSLLYRTLDDQLFKGLGQKFPITGKTFSSRMPWDIISRHIYLGIFGCTLDTSDAGAKVLAFPSLDESTEEGKLNRQRLLRCWLEISLILQTRLDKMTPAEKIKKMPNFRVTITRFREKGILLCGGDELPRVTVVNGGWSKTSDGHAIGRDDYHGLGVTPDVADSVIIRVFDQQLKLDQEDDNLLLQHLDDIARYRNSYELRRHAGTMRERGYLSRRDIIEAFKTIGCDGPEPRDFSEDIVFDAASVVLEEEKDFEKRGKVKKDLKIAAEFLKSDLLQSLYQSAIEEPKPLMEVEKAYRLFEVESGIDDDFLLTIFNIRIQDAPAQRDKMRDALISIAASRNSEKLNYYLEKGETMPIWEANATSSLTRPVGLTNIANTCYLNSLLQYFFTVKELRNAILEFPDEILPAPSSEVSNVRVGGRLVTEAEVQRSKRFVLLLQGLYRQLIYTPATSVTPTTELAYLALVPSKEENDLVKPEKETEIITMEEEESTTTPASSTDIASLTITDTSKSPSVLGKRTSDQLKESEFNLDAMVVDSPTTLDSVDADVIMSSGEIPPPRDEENSRQTRRRGTIEFNSSGELVDASGVVAVEKEETVSIIDMTLEAIEGADGVVEIREKEDLVMEDSSRVAPPLPPRPANDFDALGLEVANYMAFGKQNDVTECMDNVMFQIECALLPVEGSELATEISLVKRLFYGMMKQTLELEDLSNPEPVRTQDELFAYLLVDVASEGRTLYDGLDMVFDSSIVSIDGSVAKKRMTLIDLPPILQIQMQRVQYDKKEQKIFKSNAYMGFEEKLFMDRYLEVEEGDEEGIRKRELTNDYRREIEKARTRLELLTKCENIPKKLRDTFAFLSSVKVDFGIKNESDCLNDIWLQATELDREILDLQKLIIDSRNAIEELWKEQKTAAFELVSVFMHRGTALSGHYFIYQRAPEKWLKYNDSLITDIDPSIEIFQPTTGDTNPYFLVYVSTARLDAIESIKREH